MAKYKWDINELRNNIKELNKILSTNIDENSKQNIMEMINMYNNMILLSTKNKNENNDIMNDCLHCDSINRLIDEQIYSYQSNDLQILNTLLQSYIPFREIYKPNCELNKIPIITTNEDMIEVTKDFFNKMIPANIIGPVSKIFDHSNFINFSYNKKKNCYSGVTLFDPILNKKYIYISKTNMLIDLISLPHEMFHYIFNECEVYKVTDYNMYYTTEIEGGFANILFGDYFYQNSIESRNYFNNYFLEVYHSGISELVIRNSFLDSINNSKKLRLNKLNKSLNYLEIIPFKETNEILDYLIDPLDINIKYVLGYLVAIDLYYIYQKDPEFAFYLLKNIRYIKTENDVIGLLRRNHITFMDDGYQNFKKYIKKIERQN